MELITSEELDGLPDDPNAAFVALERICRVRLNDALQAMGMDGSPWSLKVDYVTVVSAAAEQYDMLALSDKADIYNLTDETFERFYRAAVHLATKIALHLRERRSATTVALPAGAKERLRKHLGELEAALDVVSLSERKRTRLREKLSDFASELERERSSLTRILVCLAAAAAVLPKAEDGIIKLPNAVDAILVVLGKEKLAEEEATSPPIALPSSLKPKALPAPSSTVKKPAFGKSGFDDLDDDVPF